MARLIDADDFIAEHCTDCKYAKVNGICNKEVPMCKSVQIVTELPTIAAEAVRGHWIVLGDDYAGKPVYCSNCNDHFILGRNVSIEKMKKLHKYCPNCVADMRERKDNE